MNKEEKELLLKDLCARLSYGVICFAPDDEFGDIGILWCIEPFEDSDPQITVQYPKGNTITKFCSEVKPYLRPMSSKDGAEVLEYINLKEDIVASDGITYFFETYESIDWLNKNHFDYRGLIEKGLALPATEEMYK